MSAKPNVLDVIKRIDQLHSYFAFIEYDSEKEYCNCLVHSSPALCDKLSKELWETRKPGFTMYEEVHNYYCTDRRQSIPNEYIVFSTKTKNIDIVADDTALKLFIALHAVNTPGFSEDMRLNPEWSQKFSEYFNLSDQMENDEISSFLMKTSNGDFYVFKCVDFDSLTGVSKVCSNRLTIKPLPNA
jgi:hypothetical protein